MCLCKCLQVTGRPQGREGEAWRQRGAGLLEVTGALLSVLDEQVQPE